jgi:hypothetical protein
MFVLRRRRPTSRYMASTRHRLVNGDSDIKQKDENEVWLTFPYLSWCPSPRQDHTYPVQRPSMSSLLLLDLKLIGGTPDTIHQKERLKQFVQKCLLPHHDNQKKQTRNGHIQYS